MDGVLNVKGAYTNKSQEVKERVNVKNNIRIDLAVGILFYEKLSQTIECIQSLLPSRVNMYVLNNGSSKSARQSLENIINRYEQIKIFDSEVNLGVGVGRNYLLTHTDEEWMFFIDNDIVVKTSDWLEKLTQNISLYTESEVFIPKLFDVQEGKYISWRSIAIAGDKAFHDVSIVNDLTNTFPGGASFINRKMFKRLGLYDDKMFVGFEDFELGIRAIRYGNPVKGRLIHNIELIHNHPLVNKSEDKAAVKTRYDIGSLEASFNWMTEKHNVILVGNWKDWVKNQTAKSIKDQFPTSKKDRREQGYDQLKSLINRGAELEFKFVSCVKRTIKRTIHLVDGTIPQSCTLYMTDRCNLNCSGCRRSVVGIEKSAEMTLATLQKLLSLYPSLDAFCVAGLGEPTLCSSFVDIINFLRNKGKYVGVITNGTNLSELLKLGCKPNYVSISLKGYDNQSYMANTGLAAFDMVLETYSQSKLKIGNVGFSYILTRKNYMDLNKVLALCDDIKPAFLHLTNYLAYNPKIEEEVQRIITFKDSKIVNYINGICAGRDYITVKPVYMDFDNNIFACRSYEYVINLDGNGNIGGCQRQIPPNASFGNVFRDKDPYNSQEMRRLRSLMHKKKPIHSECRFCFGNCGR